MLMRLAAMLAFLGCVVSGCASAPSERDAAELREIDLAPEKAMEAAAAVLAVQGYQLHVINASLVSASAQQDRSGERVASVTAGAAAGPIGGVVSAAGGGPVGGILTSLSIGLASGGRGRYETQLNIQTAAIGESRTAMRATAVVNGSVNPRWKALARFWEELSNRCGVGPATDLAKKAMPLGE
ncbi:hypothetical protein PHYC_01792 [Phycisphaerales bacterium]|nr:hypothetical protein PHYC_01792 [Phycisphaerales bacterium]